MKGSVQELERKKGLVFRAFIDIPNGDERRQETKTFQSWKYEDAESTANAWLTDWNQRIYNNDYVDTPDIYLTDFLTNWHDETKDQVRESTKRKRSDVIENHLVPYFDGRKLAEISSFEIQEFYQKSLEEFSPGTVGIFHDILSIAFNYGERNGLIDSNPIENIEPPPCPDQDITIWDELEIRRFLIKLREWEEDKREYINPFWSKYPLFFLAINTGMRLGELLGLRMQDLNLEDKKVYIRKALKNKNGLSLGPPKTKSSRRSIALTDETVHVLEDQLKTRDRLKEQAREKGREWQGADTVFVTSSGSMIWPSTPRRTLNSVLEETDLPRISFHGFRHTHATMLLRSGAHIYNVSQRLGHSSTETTEKIYIQYVPSMQKETVDKYQKTFDF